MVHAPPLYIQEKIHPKALIEDLKRASQRDETDDAPDLFADFNGVDPEARKEAYGKALALIAERAYAVPLYSLPVYYVAAKDLEFKAYADEMPRFWEMTWN